MASLTWDGSVSGPSSLEECLVDVSMFEIMEFSITQQCHVVKKQVIIVAEAIVFYGCSVEQEDNAEIITVNSKFFPIHS